MSPEKGFRGGGDVEVLPRLRSLLWRFGGFRDGGFKPVDENYCFGIFQFCFYRK
jgi:hypothetical protein